MDESSITRRVRDDVTAQLRGSVVIKFADRSTGSIPDFSVSTLGHTFWIEMKYVRVGVSRADVIKTNQITMCHQLATTTGGRCWIVMFEESPDRCVTIWQPRALFAHLSPKLAGPVPDAWQHETMYGNQRFGCRPHRVLSHESWAGTLFSYGAIQVPWAYDVVTKMISQSLGSRA